MTDTSELQKLLGAATQGEWQVYSEPDVGLPPSLFAGTVGQTGFGPLEPLQGVDLQLVVALKNAAPEYIEQQATISRLTAERAALVSLVSELADDLEAEIADRYEGMLPQLESRFERDMEPVRRARALVRDGGGS